jgi:acetolactate synthase small subunit
LHRQISTGRQRRKTLAARSFLEDTMTHFLLLTENRHGVLARVVSVLTSLGVNIDRASASPVPGSKWSVIEIYMHLGTLESDRMVRKLSRVIGVLAVRASEAGQHLSVEFATSLCFNASDR